MPSKWDNFIFYSILTALSIICSALASGLTQGLLSIDPLEMRIKSRGSNHEQKRRANLILPIISRRHLLLVTIMLFNALANECLPLFLDKLVPQWVAIVLSVSIVLLFGEVIPSAIFTGRSQLYIAATLSPFVWLLIFIFFPIAYPISYLLDIVLGREESLTVFDRNEIYTMMQIQEEEGQRRGLSYDHTVQRDEVNIIGGVLNMRNFEVQEVMSREVFSLSNKEKLTLKVAKQFQNFKCNLEY